MNLAYARKSNDSEDKQVLSLPDQVVALKKLASKHHIKFSVDIFQESKSAHTPGRKQFSSLIQLIEQSNEPVSIFVFHPNRLSRNPLDAGRLIYLMDTGKIEKIVTPERIFYNTPTDKFMLNLEFTISKKDSDDKSIVVKRGLNSKVEKGWFPSFAPPGYLNEKYEEQGKRKILDDPERFRLVKNMWELLLTGTRPMEILRIANEEWTYRTLRTKNRGGGKLCRTSLYRIFNDPFYYGWYEYPKGSGNWQEGKHTKMITKAEYDKAQVVLGSKGRLRPQTRSFTYAGFLKCGGCDGAVTAEYKLHIVCTNCKYKFSGNTQTSCPKCLTDVSEMLSPTIRNYVFYHCTKNTTPNCVERSIEENDLEIEIDQLLSQIEISQDFKEWAIEELNRTNDEAIQTRAQIAETQQKALKDVSGKLDNLLKLKIAPNNTNGELINDEEFIKLKNELTDEKNNYLNLIKETSRKQDQWMDDCEKTYTFACQARYQYQKASPEEKRQLISILGSNLFLKSKILCLNAPNEYLTIKKAIKDDSTIKTGFEPKVQIDGTIQTRPTPSLNPVWYRVRELNP